MEGCATAQTSPIEDTLLTRMLDDGESFWSVVFTPFMHRDLTRAELDAVISNGLERSGGSYRSLVRFFNMPDTDYRRFLNFLRHHSGRGPLRTRHARLPLPGPQPYRNSLGELCRPAAGM